MLEQGSIDGWDALELVVAPPAGRLSDENIAARVRYPLNVPLEARMMRDAGVRQVDIAHRLGVPATTVKYWCGAEWSRKNHRAA